MLVGPCGEVRGYVGHRAAKEKLTIGAMGYNLDPGPHSESEGAIAG